ncbi:class I adenylate-forming enzyme family protein [Acidimangrovimonas pyrenivorans]|uniref:Class I adenylate-forming enzyme family protein n=1 Tax=Acidimangrovimonas pyrenivorans TaxID=2030798 RepID=A0ABV7AF09_9RHOB
MPLPTPHPKTLDAFTSHYAAATPEAEAAVDGSLRLSYATLNLLIDFLCAWLDEKGIRRGDRVAIAAAPGIPYLMTLLAASRLGAIYVGVNPRYSESEIAHVLAVTKPAILLHAPVPREQDLASRLSRAAGDIPVLPVPTAEGLAGQVATHHSPAQPDDVAVIVFTSGSTGKPKGAALHHGGLIGAATGQHEHLDGEARRYISNLPINHVGAIMNNTMACVVGGGTLVFQPKFSPSEVMELIERERIQTWLQVPAMFTMVANHDDFGRRDLSSLRSICIGGGAVSAPTLARLRETGAEVFVEYGQTEVMSSLSYSDPGAPDEVLLNTIGRFDPRFETRIARADGTLCEEGEVGEIQARGDCVLRSYWGDDAATSEAFTAEGWLHTGDLAFLRPDGNVTIKGRLREMIKSGGYNVYPREVEVAIESHPAVAEVVVYGVADEVYGEAVHCALECKPGASVTGDELKAHCAGSLANYKIPKLFAVVPALPRLSNGKLDRAAVCNGELG